MSINTMKLCKRNVFERKALRMIRGAERDEAREEAVRPIVGGTGLDECNQAHFGCLRAFALRNGLVILPEDSPYLTSSELLMLRWLAEAQRQSGLRTCHFGDVGLKTSLWHCAILLKGLGTCLPAKTLHIHTDLDDRLPAVNGMRHRKTQQGITVAKRRSEIVLRQVRDLSVHEHPSP